MPYITREDGERFVIPSYRDVLSAKKPALLKKEVLLLSTNYGEYVALQRKNVDQYEAAFSTEAGYLLGESVWHYFKRPFDLIYCEAIPNTNEAILVIVKAGSVYLDGSFPIESIPDELVIFRTQQNNFEIYLHGDVPISQQPEEGKFFLDASSVKSFTILPEPIFPTLPKIKAFQLRLVDVALKAQGIGAFPLKKIAYAGAALAVVWMAITFLMTHKRELPKVLVGVVNPYQLYLDGLTTPDPAEEIHNLLKVITQLYTIPGWMPDTINYANGKLQAKVLSSGAKTSVLFDWASKNQANVTVSPDGFYVSLLVSTYSRLPPDSISPIQQVIGKLIDRISTVTPGNVITLGQIANRGSYSEAQLTYAFDGKGLPVLDLIGKQFRGLPLVLTKALIKNDNGNLSGSFTLKALGN